MSAAMVSPPGAQCFRNTSNGWNVCPATADMVSFLNLTSSFSQNYFPAYCINPPDDDGCPYGYCPNADIAGPLVRISAYLTNLLVAILVFYNAKDLRESFWSQILTVYSLLITCGVSIIQRQLSRIHAILATATAGSPLSLYIVVYAIRSIWDDSHRLTLVVGPGRIIPRLIVLTAFGVWISLVVYIRLPSHLSHFAQTSCDQVRGSFIIKYFFFLPINIFMALGTQSVAAQWVVTLPIQFSVFAWLTAIWLRRRDIWPRGQKYTFRFWTVWRVVSDNYPFIQFTSVVMIPFMYWCATIETAALSSNDDFFSATFGQVLAIFVTVPPMIACAKLLPRFGRWFADLAWVRFITFRPQRRTMPFEQGISMGPTLGDYAKLDRPLMSPDDRGTYETVVPLPHWDE